MMKNTKDLKPIDAKVADLKDEDLKAIIELRKKISEQKERESYIKGLLYISLVDNDYSEEEQIIVEGTACALGINDEKLKQLTAEIVDNVYAINTFTVAGNKKFKELLFEEMGALTYIKGYQLSIEDEKLKEVAKKIGIPDEKADKIMTDLFIKSQGISDAASSKALAAKIILGAGGIAAGVAICAITAGVAAPAVGALIGSGMGLSGAAASSAGLAAIGGGALAAGGGGVAAGTAAVVAAGAIVGGSGAAMTLSVKENVANAYDKKKLKALITKQQKEDMTKQEITENLIKAIEALRQRLKVLEEKNASKRDIEAIKTQIANMETQKSEIENGDNNGQ